MRTVKIVLALVAAVVIFNSCNKDYAEPKITWTPDKLSQLVEFDNEDTWNQTLNINFEAEAGIKEIKIWKNIYKNGQVSPIAELMEAPTGYEGLTSFDYTFSTNHTAESFKGGVMKIVYEFEVSDNSEETQLTSKDYIFFVIDTYSVTFVVKDAQGNEVNDAKVVLGENELTAAPYVFDFVPKGDYDYTISKAGYQTVTGSFEMGEEDQVINITLVSDLSDWSEKVMLTLSTQTNYAEYNGVRVETNSNSIIGVKYDTNTSTHSRLVTTSNNEGFVKVADDSYTSASELEAAYNAGTKITQLDVSSDYHAKAFEQVIFISKVDGNYVLVKYVDGVNYATAQQGYSGNVLVFQYKN